MKCLFHKFLIVCCALYLSGAHWMVLQTTAWTGMLLSRSSRAGVAEAVTTTFSGEQPCRMCVAISKGEQEEREHQPLAPVLKKMQEIKLVAMDSFELPARVSGGEMQWPEFVCSDPWRTEAPPVPPPLA